MANITAGHSQLAKTVEAEEGSISVTKEENETEFGEYRALALPWAVFPLDLLLTF